MAWVDGHGHLDGGSARTCRAGVEGKPVAFTLRRGCHGGDVAAGRRRRGGGGVDGVDPAAGSSSLYGERMAEVTIYHNPN